MKPDSPLQFHTGFVAAPNQNLYRQGCKGGLTRWLWTLSSVWNHPQSIHLSTYVRSLSARNFWNRFLLLTFMMYLLEPRFWWFLFCVTSPKRLFNSSLCFETRSLMLWHLQGLSGTSTQNIDHGVFSLCRVTWLMYWLYGCWLLHRD